MGLKLGFHYHVPAIARQGKIYMPGYLGRFVDSLAMNCEMVVCFFHSPLPSEMTQMDYPLHSSNVNLVNIGPHDSIPHRLVTIYRPFRLVRERIKNLDAFLIRGASPLLYYIARAAKNIPVAFLIVSDYLPTIDGLPQPRWRREAIRLWARWNYRQQLSVLKDNLTFVNSRLLYEQFRPIVPLLYETRTTTLTDSDFSLREDTCLVSPYKILYVGRIVKEKGILELIKALSILHSMGTEIRLDIIGWPVKNDDTLDLLNELVTKFGLDHKIVYHGYKAVGQELFDFYKSADIFIIASTSNFEGFPRVIWEAMAHCLPVIATKVGSIPYFLKHKENALLVEPKNPLEIAQSILMLINDKQLRQKLIKNGFTIARNNTLNKRTKELISKIESLL